MKNFKFILINQKKKIKIKIFLYKVFTTKQQQQQKLFWWQQ
jgi:hypothetical protein